MPPNTSICVGRACLSLATEESVSYGGQNRRVFVRVYSHADKDFARRNHHELQMRGIRCWLDEHQLLPGDDIYHEVKSRRNWRRPLRLFKGIDRKSTRLNSSHSQ